MLVAARVSLGQRVNLQEKYDYPAEGFAHNFMMHLLVADVDAWWTHIEHSGVVAKYGVRITDIEVQPWRMRDFCLFDPSGVVWRIGQNTD